MKKLIAGVAVKLLLLGTLVAAQQSSPPTAQTPEAAAIKAEAENCSRAFTSGDFGKLIDLTYPKLIELSGGREKALAEVEGQMKELRDSGMKIISMTLGEPEPSVRAGATRVAVVPLRLRIEMPEQDIEVESFWLAVSTDEGKVWRFISGTSVNADALKLFLPEAVGKIKLPAVKQHVMERKPANPKAAGASRR